MTGRAPMSGVYLDANRAPALAIDIEVPDRADDTLWPLLGWLVGRLAPDRIPLLTGLSALQPGTDELKPLCAAFGTTSGAPMLHIEGVTPEAPEGVDGALERVAIGRAELEQAWRALNQGPDTIDLVALGSPHMSAPECRAFARLMGETPVASGVGVIITIGRSQKREIGEDGTLERLERLGVTIVSDVCWCSISKPLFPASARNILTNSGKYAHYGPSLTGCTMRLGSLAECALAAKSGTAAVRVPHWLS
jgi:predicted aconitase